MKVRRFFVSFILMVFVTSEVYATGAIDFEFSADYVSKYIWRGQNLVDDPVFQPVLSASYKGLTAAIWGNLETTSINNNSGEFTEWDFSLDHSGELPGIEGLGYSIGLINYHFPSVVGDTTEFYWGLNFDVPLSPSITLYHDIDEINGTYASFAVSHSFDKIAELGPDSPVGMEIAAALGWGSSGYNEGYWGLDESELNDLTISLYFPVDIDGWTLVPSLNYITLLSDDIRSTDAYDTDSDYFLVSIGLSKSF
jgi:hypothetical protein